MMAALGRTGLSGCTAASRMRTLPTLPARISLSCWVLFSSAVCQLGVHAHVAHQPHHVLFQVGQLLDVVADAVHVAGQRGDLPVDGQDAGVSGREARDQVLALGAQFHHLGLRVHRLRQDQLGFLAQVDGAALVAQGVVPGLGRVQVLLHLGSCCSRKLNDFGLRRLPVHVLLHVLRADLVQHGGGQRGIVAFQRDADHARGATALEDAHARLRPRWPPAASCATR